MISKTAYTICFVVLAFIVQVKAFAPSSAKIGLPNQFL